MRKYGKWVLVLGVMSACPTDASADGFLSRMKPRLPFSEASDQERNQQQANDVIGAMRKAQVQGESIQVQVTDGVAVISGTVTDPAQRSLAQRAAGTVPGITRVQNDIKYVPPGGGQLQPAGATSTQAQAAPVTRAAGADTAASGRQIQQVAGVASPGPMPARPAPATQPAVPPAKAAAPKSSNDTAVARHVAQSLADAGLLNYDIEVRCTNGVATLIGQVDSPAQRQAAAQAASSVPGVSAVHNGLSVAKNVAQVSAPVASRTPAMQPAPMPMQMAQMQMPMQGGAMPMQAGPGMMPPTAVGYAPTSYNHPHLPPYAWPSYAQYPNSAAVTYPTQYSASAWPYIGPFYPYPQVPMGWREVSLEWDDGYWQLNFNKEKDKWYWVLNPSNW
ncbi:MAG: BON domain-containing protein [Planctomycetota bacterium]